MTEYKRLGDYIRELNVRNREDEVLFIDLRPWGERVG